MDEVFRDGLAVRLGYIDKDMVEAAEQLTYRGQPLIELSQEELDRLMNLYSSLAYDQSPPEFNSSVPGSLPIKAAIHIMQQRQRR